MKIKSIHTAAALGVLLHFAGLAALAADSTDLGTVKIAGEGDDLGNGLYQEDDGTKERSAVTKGVIERARPTSNPFQLLELEPGVNTSSYDATGMFGGNLRIRGFNSDEMGFTINGAPVNDSGNFAVYPQEYSDVENLCSVFVTQGSVDTDAPHTGASGGNVGMVSCAPSDKAGVAFNLSGGMLNFQREFVRFESGLTDGAHPQKLFLSVSNADVDKFKGPGGAIKQHVDIGYEMRITEDTKFTSNILVNRELNNNYLTLTLAQYAQNPDADFSSVIPQHTGTNDKVLTSFSTSGITNPAYYGYSLNPFWNVLYTGRLESRISSQVTLSAEPYFWYGYGTGGTEQNTLTESASTSSKFGLGIASIDGGVSNNVGIYTGSVTKTDRPGITFKALIDSGVNHIETGYWIEQALQRQTKPATTVTNLGTIGDLWLQSSLLLYNNGQVYEGRNYLTESTGSSLFVIDKVTLDNDRLLFTPGVRYTQLRRQFTNYASSGSGLGANYTADATYGELLPSAGFSFKMSDQWQVYGDVTRNMRSPSNFVLSGWVSSVTYVNGAVSTFTLNPNTAITDETSVNSELGLRYSGDVLKGSITVYNVNFKNRIAAGYDPVTDTYTDYNVGDSQDTGVEFQIGTNPVKGWSAFISLTSDNDKLKSDFNTSYASGVNAGQLVTVPTNGKTMVDSPNLMAGAQIQYSNGGFIADLSAKYTASRYTTLMNDEQLPSYTNLNFDAGYRFKDAGSLKEPTLRLNVTNLTDAKYLLANSGSGSSISLSSSSTYSTVNGYGVPSYYVGAPRFISLSFSGKF